MLVCLASISIHYTRYFIPHFLIQTIGRRDPKIVCCCCVYCTNQHEISDYSYLPIIRYKHACVATTHPICWRYHYNANLKFGKCFQCVFAEHLQNRCFPYFFLPTSIGNRILYIHAHSALFQIPRLSKQLYPKNNPFLYYYFPSPSCKP